MCSYCPQARFICAYKKISNIVEMDFDTFRRCLDKINKFVRVYFSGFTEPWLNRNCLKMILYAHKKGHRIQLYTTLVGMNVEDIETISKIHFESFVVHLPDGNGNTSIEINEQYIAVLKSVISRIPNAFYLYFGDIHPELKPLLKTTKTTRSELMTRANNIEIKGKKIDRKSGPIRCTRPIRSNILLPSGDVVLCCHDFGMKHVLGNLLKSDYDSLFTGEEYKNVFKGTHDDSIEILCRYCSDSRSTNFQKREGRIVRLLKKARTMKVFLAHEQNRVRQISFN